AAAGSSGTAAAGQSVKRAPKTRTTRANRAFLIVAAFRSKGLPIDPGRYRTSFARSTKLRIDVTFRPRLNESDFDLTAAANKQKTERPRLRGTRRYWRFAMGIRADERRENGGSSNGDLPVRLASRGRAACERGA